MRFHRFVSTLCAASLLALSSPALAQSSHTADASALQQALQTKVSTDEANRAVVLQVLASSEARAVATRLGLDITQAQEAVALSAGSELTQLATTARAAQVERSGGSNTIVISTTTLLLILIVIILLVR